MLSMVNNAIIGKASPTSGLAIVIFDTFIQILVIKMLVLIINYHSRTKPVNANKDRLSLPLHVIPNFTK